jgi:hypothetical protein
MGTLLPTDLLRGQDFVVGARCLPYASTRFDTHLNSAVNVESN